MNPFGVRFAALPKNVQCNPSSLCAYTSTDEGNATPRYFRCTHQAIPPASGLIGPGMQPFGAVVQPFADPGSYEAPIPVVKSSGASGDDILRCGRCGAYMNPGFVFLEGGTSFRCNLCDCVSAVPTTYIAGSMSTENARPEMKFGSYEVAAPAALQGRKVTGQSMLILIDCSPTAYQSGLTQQVLASVKASLDYLPCQRNYSLAIVTYNHAAVNFYFSSGPDKEPGVVCMGDITTPFAPLPRSKVMLNVAEKRQEIEAILAKVESICSSHASESSKPAVSAYQSCGGAALRSAVEVLKSQGGGKVLWFFMEVPNAGVGTARSRNSTQLWNTDKEAVLLRPDETNTFYTVLAQECVAAGVGVDTFACHVGEADVASIFHVSGATGGEVHYYPSFNSSLYHDH